MTILSETALQKTGVFQWPDIAGAFKASDILLGNGFSMNLTNVFGYGALFPRFLSNCSPADQAALAGFNTTNFEFILEDLGTAARVNALMSLPTAQVLSLANRVREGLIRTIEAIHPRKHAVDWTRLELVAGELNHFNDVYTLNYDALLYHIIMICKDRYVRHGHWRRYNDYFWNAISANYLQFMEFQNIAPYNHVYYLHGALFLFKLDQSVETLTEIDVKLRTGGASELLDAIATELRGGTLPLFVSEGRADEKQRAISRSEYLRFANEALEMSRPKLVIYGASLGDQDEHIAQAVCNGTAEAAVSVYPAGKTSTQLEQEINAMKSRLPGVHLTFFDSRSLFK